MGRPSRVCTKLSTNWRSSSPLSARPTARTSPGSAVAPSTATVVGGVRGSDNKETTPPSNQPTTVEQMVVGQIRRSPLATLAQIVHRLHAEHPELTARAGSDQA
jgi:hypothetical protein